MSSIIKVDTVQDQDGNNIINENANTITIGASGDTITIPSGATLTNNGTATGFFEGIAWQSITTAATLTTVAGKGYPINTTSNACTVTLPSSASVGDQIQIVDYAGTFATNSITLTSSLNINGATDDKILSTNREGVTITYVDATQGWVATSGVNSGSQALDPVVYSADFLVIAGGGAGGNDNGGAGGAGGYRNSFGSETSGGGGSSESSITLIGGTTYTITVGAGGTGTTGSGGSVGIDSSIAGTGITTITSAGGGIGGAGGGATNVGGAGGSGGGGQMDQGGSNKGLGTSNQGFDGGDGQLAGNSVAGGGGGAAEAGNTDGNGEGGDGLASAITGSSVTRGGGGGGVATSGAGRAGAGGGGTGAHSSGSGNAGGDGSANTGGGGGGGGPGAGKGGNGGSGVVILSMPLANFSGTTTGSPTESDDGTTKRLIFNGDGSYTG